MRVVLLGRRKLRELAKRRGCIVSDITSVVCTLRSVTPGTAVERQVVATSFNKWHPADVIQACTILTRGTVRSFSAPEGLQSPEGFNEATVAELLAAIGVGPYWAGGYGFAMHALVRAFMLRPIPMSDSKQVRAAVKGVVDAGLARLTLGERGGFSNDHLNWDPPRERPPRAELTAGDEEALRVLAAA